MGLTWCSYQALSRRWTGVSERFGTSFRNYHTLLVINLSYGHRINARERDF